MRHLRALVRIPILALLALLALPVVGPMPAGTAAAAERSVTLTMTKARSIDLPVDVRDVLVANPEIADVVVKTPRQAYLIAAKVGDTNAFFLDENGREVLKLNIRVEMDLDALREALRTLVPDADVEARAVNENVVLTGAVPSALVAENVRQIARRFVPDDQHILNMVQITSGQQVVIRVKVAEMRRTVAKKLGVNLFLQDGNVAAQSGAAPSAAQIFNRFGVARFSGSPGIDLLTASIEALEEDGLVKTLAEPNLTALSGESASFLAGGEFPIPISEEDGKVKVDFKQFGVGLKFTPVVLSSGRINLRISTEVSDLSEEGAISIGSLKIPALAVRRAETMVEIPSGGSMVLAGLLRNDVGDVARGLPGLSRLPVLGPLFRSTDFQHDESELVVIATPYIVRPTAPQQVMAPTDVFGPASDIDLYLLGRLYSRYADPAQAPAPQAPTPGRPAGYIME